MKQVPLKSNQKKSNFQWSSQASWTTSETSVETVLSTGSEIVKSPLILELALPAWMHVFSFKWHNPQGRDYSFVLLEQCPHMMTPLYGMPNILIIHLVNNKWTKPLSEAKLRKIKTGLVQPIRIIQRQWKGQLIVCALGEHWKRNTAPVNWLAEECAERSIFILCVEKGAYMCSISKQTFYLQVVNKHLQILQMLSFMQFL